MSAWKPLPLDTRNRTIDAMERRFDRGAVNKHEWETYVGTLRATAYELAKDDPDRARCLELARRVEAKAKLSDDAFVASMMRSLEGPEPPPRAKPAWADW